MRPDCDQRHERRHEDRPDDCLGADEAREARDGKGGRLHGRRPAACRAVQEGDDEPISQRVHDEAHRLPRDGPPAQKREE